MLLDEAHLCPPFEALRRQVESHRDGKPDPVGDSDSVTRPFRLMSLFPLRQRQGSVGDIARGRVPTGKPKTARRSTKTIVWCHAMIAFFTANKSSDERAGRVNSSEIYSLAFGRHICPDPWQQQFASDEWPNVLIAPTGSGKTAGVTLGWAAHRLRAPEATPRRLVWCLPMRSLVEQTAGAVRDWFGGLCKLDVGRGLLPEPQDVHVLMGGVEAARWLDSPERPAVIIGTQDMLLSRALMRGYASSRAIWPMEFALLHLDAQWVFDEVQLMGAGRATSAQLEAFRLCDAGRTAQEGRMRPRFARSLWISATLEPDWLRTVDFRTPDTDAVRRVDPQQERDERLRRLATAKKVLTRTSIAPESGKTADVDAYVAQLARSVLESALPRPHDPDHPQSSVAGAELSMPCSPGR